MAYCLFLTGKSFDRAAWVDDVQNAFGGDAPASLHRLSPLCLQWTEFDENLESGEAWLHSLGGIRGVTVRPEGDGITLSIPTGNSGVDFALAWELMRLGAKHGGETSGESHDGIIPLTLSDEETERITRDITSFHWNAVLSVLREQGQVSIPVAGRISLGLDSEDAALGAEALEQRLVERMSRYSQAFSASLMQLKSKDGVESLLAVYGQIPTLVNAEVELIQVTGDNLPPDIKVGMLPLKAEVVYDLVGAERLGNLVYLPPLESEMILQVLIALAMGPEKETVPAPGIPKPPIPAPGVAAGGNEMSGADWATLAKAPCLVFFLVAAADGGIDRKELMQFGKLLQNQAKIPTPFVRRIMNITTSNLEAMIGSLSDVNPMIALIEILTVLRSDKIAAEDSAAFANYLYKLGEDIASASGGFFGFGSKISKKEAEILASLKGLLGV